MKHTDFKEALERILNETDFYLEDSFHSSRGENYYILDNKNKYCEYHVLYTGNTLKVYFRLSSNVSDIESSAFEPIYNSAKRFNLIKDKIEIYEELKGLNG